MKKILSAFLALAIMLSSFGVIESEAAEVDLDEREFLIESIKEYDVSEYCVPYRRYIADDKLFYAKRLNGCPGNYFSKDDAMAIFDEFQQSCSSMPKAYEELSRELYDLTPDGYHVMKAEFVKTHKSRLLKANNLQEKKWIMEELKEEYSDLEFTQSSLNKLKKLQLERGRCWDKLREYRVSVLNNEDLYTEESLDEYTKAVVDLGDRISYLTKTELGDFDSMYEEVRSLLVYREGVEKALRLS